MKTGRNDPCPCGSGKKYKHCCLKSNIIPFPGNETQSGNKSVPPTMPSPDMAAGIFGYSSPEDFDVAMAEYGAYCESLPENAPIPSFNEYRGIENGATAVMKGLQSEIAGKNFASIEEAEEFMSRKIVESNNQGIEDFLGLSPDMMRNIIFGEFSYNSSLVTLNKKITNKDVEQTPVMKRVKTFFDVYVDYADRSTLPLTATGRLKPEFCHLYYEAVTGKDRGESWINNEDDYSALQIVAIMLDDLGYIKMLKTRCKLTDKGLAFLALHDSASAYREFFEYYIDKFDWGWNIDGLDKEPLVIIQNAALFSLYILKEKANGKKNEVEIFNYFVKAFFKDILAEVEEEAEEEIILLLFSTFRTAFFEYFCAFFGLIEADYLPEEFDFPDSKIQAVKPTALFKKLFMWKF